VLGMLEALGLEGEVVVCPLRSGPP